MKKIVLGVMVVAFSLALASTSFAKKKGYVEGAAGPGSITGTVMLKGDAMAPIMEDLSKGKNVEFCTTHSGRQRWNPTSCKVSAAGGKLKDAVVFYRENRWWQALGRFG